MHPCAACTKSGLECNFFEPERKKQRGGAAGVRAEQSETSQFNARGESIHGTLAPSPSTSPRLGSDGSRNIPVRNGLESVLSPENVSPKVSDGSLTTGNPIPNVTRMAGGVLSRYSESEGDGQTSPNANHSNGETRPESFFPFSSNEARETSSQLEAKHTIALWEAFIDNVDPMLKILHVPTVQKLVLGSIGATWRCTCTRPLSRLSYLPH